MLSVLSYNILYGKRLYDIRDWILKERNTYDIYCFQEFPKNEINTFLSSLTFASSFSYLYSHAFTRRGVFGQLTLFDHTKLKLASSSIVMLGHPSRLEKTIFRLKGERSALISTFFFSGKLFTVVNTHLTAMNTNTHRRGQLHTILDNLRSPLPNEPCIILGDYNYTSLYTRRKLISLMNSSGFMNAHTHKTHKLWFITHQLDYVFYKNCAIKQVIVHNLPFSDHLPASFSFSFQDII